jgi:hypothetical protein
VSTITVPRAVLEQALEALEAGVSVSPKSVLHDRLRAALAQQEPTVRFKCTVVDNQHPSGVPFEQWVNAPRREWQSLTDDEIDHLWLLYPCSVKEMDAYARAIEAKLKEKT